MLTTMPLGSGRRSGGRVTGHQLHLHAGPLPALEADHPPQIEGLLQAQEVAIELAAERGVRHRQVRHHTVGRPRGTSVALGVGSRRMLGAYDRAERFYVTAPVRIGGHCRDHASVRIAHEAEPAREGPYLPVVTTTGMFAHAPSRLPGPPAITAANAAQ